MVNQVIRITPQRNDMEKLLAKIAVALLEENTSPGDLVNIGVGMPELAAKDIFIRFIFRFN